MYFRPLDLAYPGTGCAVFVPSVEFPARVHVFIRVASEKEDLRGVPFERLFVRRVDIQEG
jgi:hypothetical protein